LRATTGFQNRNYTQLELLENFSNKLNIYNTNKTLEFLQTSLTSAIDVIKQGGHVTRKFSDRKFSLLYDNRREILDLPLIYKLLSNLNNNNNNNNNNSGDEVNKLKYHNLSNQDNKFKVIKTLKEEFKLGISSNININNNNNNNNNINENNNLFKDDNNKYYILLDTSPLVDSDKCYNLRSIANRFRVNEYNQRTSISNNKKYKDFTDLAIRNFVKIILSEPPLFPKIASDLKDYTGIIKFIKGFKIDYRITKPSLSNLKNRPLIKRQVPRTDETILFISYVKAKYNDFDETLFFNK